MVNMENKMTLRHLKIFTAVCEYGGITKAAEALHLTQPAVSHTISELEKYYDFILFDRINQRLVITDMGREILLKAHEIIGAFKEFEEFAHFGGNSPKVRIGCSLTLGQTVIPQYLRRAYDMIERIEPQIVIATSSEIESGLEMGRFDFAILDSEVSSPYLIVKPLIKDRLIFIANKESMFPHKMTAYELSCCPLILREQGSASREIFENMMKKECIEVEPLIQSENNQAIVSCLYASLGIALMPESFVIGHIQRGRFEEIEVEGFEGTQNSYIAIHKSKKLNDIGKKAYDILMND